MWLLVLVTFVSMTAADTFYCLNKLLLAAQINSLLFKIPLGGRSWEYRKHDLANTVDGFGDITSAFAVGGTAFSLITIAGSAKSPTVIFHFTGWTALTALAMLLGSQIGGTMGDFISKRVQGVPVREMSQSQTMMQGQELMRRGAFHTEFDKPDKRG